jgi:tRNA A-37 threonylcarbamoyl transferase component Bud32
MKWNTETNFSNLSNDIDSNLSNDIDSNLSDDIDSNLFGGLQKRLQKGCETGADEGVDKGTDEGADKVADKVATADDAADDADDDDDDAADDTADDADDDADDDSDEVNSNEPVFLSYLVEPRVQKLYDNGKHIDARYSVESWQTQQGKIIVKRNVTKRELVMTGRCQGEYAPTILGLQNGRTLILEHFGEMDMFQYCSSIANIGVDTTKTVDIFQSMIEAVRAVHVQDLAHMDIALENFLLHTVGSIVQVKLCDFDTVRHVNEQLNLRVGRSRYHPPEYFQDDVDEDCQLADVWALGVCFSTLLIKGHLFDIACRQDKRFKFFVKHGFVKFVAKLAARRKLYILLEHVPVCVIEFVALLLRPSNSRPTIHQVHREILLLRDRISYT